MLPVDHVHAVRHAVRVLGKSERQVAREFGIARNTIRRYLDDSVVPQARKPSALPRPAPVRDSLRAQVFELLDAQAATPHGKQRLTAARIVTLLRERLVTAGYTSVKRLVREHKRAKQEVFVPLVYRPGDLAEVDFFEVLVTLGASSTKVFLFVMRLMSSGFDFACLLPRADQVCFLEGHVRAFAHFGGVPHRIAYDNLKAAVRTILVGSERELSLRFGALASSYLFEPCFARPYTGHDKGGVEARGKGIRWQHLTPVPVAASLEEINALLLRRLAEQVETQRDASGRSTRERFELEKPCLLPLPSHAFESAAKVAVVASSQSLVRLDGAHYSVPCGWARLTLMAHSGVDFVRIDPPLSARSDEGPVTHKRVAKGLRSVDYRHYLRELAHKPQALRQVADELVPSLGPPFDRAWRHLVDLHGPKVASRIFAKMLEALLEHRRDWVVERIERALLHGEPLQLAMRSELACASLRDEQVPQSLREVEVEGSSAADFDALLEAS
jgi:transposase